MTPGGDMYKKFILVSISILIAAIQFFWPPILWSLIIVIPLILLGLHDILQSTHALRRNYPLLGRGRWVLEAIRPFFRQYLIASDTDGVPINRVLRSIVYQRAKGDRDTVPFGTRVDTYRTGYEWVGHSLSARDVGGLDQDLRVNVGRFYHNTGEGGLSPYHEEHGGGLVWQIGTGYFGCRNEKGEFCSDKFEKNQYLSLYA
jgi:hypothetical protein